MIMRILVNAQFPSLKSQPSPINALAVKDGRILALGSNDEMREDFVGRVTELVEKDFGLKLPKI